MEKVYLKDVKVIIEERNRIRLPIKHYDLKVKEIVIYSKSIDFTLPISYKDNVLELFQVNDISKIKGDLIYLNHPLVIDKPDGNWTNELYELLIFPSNNNILYLSGYYGEIIKYDLNDDYYSDLSKYLSDKDFKELQDFIIANK